MTRSRTLGILIVVVSLVALLIAAVIVRRQRPVTDAPVQNNVSLELPGMRVKPSEISSSTTPGWDVYSSEQLQVQLEIPSSWQRREYTEERSKKVVAVAFDPLNVATEAEYRTYDKPPGRVWVGKSRDKGASVIGVTTTRMVGPERIPMKYGLWVPEKEGPNSLWFGTVSEDYYSTSATVPIDIRLFYPSADLTNRAAQSVLRRILGSVRSVPGFGEASR